MEVIILDRDDGSVQPSRSHNFVAGLQLSQHLLPLLLPALLRHNQEKVKNGENKDQGGEP